MADLQSNRDLYVEIEHLTEQYRPSSRTLEEYLRAMLQLSHQFTNHESLSLQDFYGLICESFTADPAEFNEDWRDQYDLLSNRSFNFWGWQATLIRQIVDLHEMKETGILDDEYRYFGVDSPRGSRWYNFDPAGYLECGMTGSLGGWEPDDQSDRQFVPGAVGVLAEDGSIQTVNPQDLPRPQFDLSTITWDEFRSFIDCGRDYE